MTGATVDPLATRPATTRETGREEMRGINDVWEFRVQLCRKLQRQPVEDPAIELNEDEAAFQRVGVVKVCAQDSWDDALVRLVDETMRFGVWTGLAAHQPLGNINRAARRPTCTRPNSTNA